MEQYPKLKDLDIKDLPIIVYCKKTCDASNLLLRRLRKLNYINLIYYDSS